MQKGKVLAIWMVLFALLTTPIFANTSPLRNGNISLKNGKTNRFVCKNTLGKTLVYIKHEEITDGKYAFVITNKKNIILGYSENSTLDFTNVPADDYRVWGVAYKGWKKRPTGISLKKASLASGDFKISDNHVNVYFSTITAPNITTVKGKKYHKITEESSPIVEFNHKGKKSKSNFVFVVTNYRGRIVGLTEKAFDFSAFATGKFQVYGLSYTGDLNVRIGDFMAGEITNGCYEKSPEYVLVDKDDSIIEERKQTLKDIAPAPVFVSINDQNMTYAPEVISASLAAEIDKEAVDKEAIMIQKLEEQLINQCKKYAGIVLPDNNQAFINDDIITISATTTLKPILGKKGSIKYLLVQESTQTITGVANIPSFTIAQAGTYHIYPFVANFKDNKAADFFDENTIQLGKTTLTALKNQLSSTAICADLAAQGATIIISTTQNNCMANSGTMQMEQPYIQLNGDDATITAQQIETSVIPKGFEQIFLLTHFNQVIAYSNEPSFSVMEEGDYSIISVIQEVRNVGTRTQDDIKLYVSQPNISIFNLIEWIDTNQICASVSNWNYASVHSYNAMSFNYSANNTIRVNNIY